MSKAGMKMMLICDGELINDKSEHTGGMLRGGWVNPLDTLPPIGSIIEYMTFNQGSHEGKGVLTEFEVKGYRFTTEEDYNQTYTNKTCKILVSRID